MTSTDKSNNAANVTKVATTDVFSKRVITAIVGGIIFFGTFWLGVSSFTALVWGIFGYIFLFEWPKLMRPIRPVLWLPYTMIFIVIPAALLSMPVILGREPGSLMLYPFIVAWIHDTSAYFVGKRFGRHYIAPRISPGKTWEGLLGGILGVLIAHVIFVPLKMIDIVRILPAPLLAFLGDLAISRFKRRAGLKDMGVILPGHGGLLDRFDSVLLVSYWSFFRLIFWVRP